MAKNVIPPLPDGFQLDEDISPPAGFVLDQPDETVPDLPAGFELDRPTPTLERLGKGFGMGVAGSVEGLGGGLEFLGEQIPMELAPVLRMAMKFGGKQLSNLGKSRREFYTIKDPDLAYNIASGAGSMGTFLIPGIGAGKIIQAAKLAPKIAVAVAAGVSGTLEAMTEGGSAYHRALEKGMDEKGAIAAGNATFALNVPTTILLNRIGIFGDSAKEILRGLKKVAATGKVLGMAALSEGTQEALQQVISNTAVSDDPSQGVFESALIGAITGGGFKTIQTISDATAPKTDQPRMVDLTQPETIQAPPPSPEILAEVAKSEPTFNVEPGVQDVTPPPPEGFQLDQPQEINSESLKNSVEKLGGKFLEVQPANKSMYGEDTLWYNTPSGSTQSIPISEFSEDLLKKKINTFEEAFAIGKKKKFRAEAERKMKVLPTYKDLYDAAIEKGNTARAEIIKSKMDKLALTPDEEQALIEDFMPPPPKGFEVDQGPESVPPGAQESTTAFAETAPAGDATVNIKPIESIELVGLAMDLMKGNVPFNKNLPKSHGYFMPAGNGKIAINNKLFQRGNEQQLAKTLAHEIGHLIDYLPEQMMNRGDLYDRLMVLRDHVKNNFADLANQDLRKELYALSKEWRPYNEETASESHKKYRQSSVEIYADFISALFNDPNYTKQKAPKAFDLFFQTLDRKMEVKMAYFAIQDILNGEPTAVLEARQKNIRRMYAKGDALREQIQNQKQLEKINYWERIRQMIDDINYPIIAKRKKADQKGQFLPPSNSPEYQLEEQSLVDNDNYLLVGRIDQEVLKPLTEKNLTDKDLGEYLFLKRVEGIPGIPTQGQVDQANKDLKLSEEESAKMKELVKRMADRQDIANPLGFAPQAATKQLAYLRQQVGEEAFATLEKSAQAFHDIVFESVVEAVKVGSYSKQTFEQIILPNKNHYATFGVLNYLQEFVPATVKMQKGTLLEIENPFITTVLKTISLNRLNSRQRAVNAVRDWIGKEFPGEITQAKEGRDGGFIKPSYASKKGLIFVLENGKLNAYEVDKYIAESVNSSKIGDAMLIGHMINKVFQNNLFKNLYITYNPGFAFALNPIRDFKRAYVNLNALGAKVSILSLMRTYAESLPTAIARQRGINDDLAQKMLQEKALDTPFIDFNFDVQSDSYHSVLRQLKLLKGEEHIYQKMMKPILRPVLQIMEGIRFAGSTLESLTKIAGYKTLVKSGKYSDKEMAYIVRNYVGTPNYRKGGSITPATNSIFMFSNIMIQGLKSDAQLATHPSTRSGFIWSHFKLNLLPKLLMFMAAAGWLGKELKDAFDKQTEYDKTNYITVPLGEDENGKAIYFRIPHDESGRLMAAMMWKVLNAAEKGEPEKLQQVLAFGAGQLPNVAPGIDIAGKWFSYLSGKNPYDAFRGQTLISDTVWKAGGYPALKKMVQWTTNNSGLIQFATYDDSNKSTTENIITSVPGVNRLFKVSDYGINESFKEDRAKIEQKNAQRTLKKRELVDKGIERIKNGESQHSVMKDIANQLYEKPTGEQRRAIVKELQQQQSKGQNIYIDSLLSATTNEEKLLIIREMRQRFDAKTMRQLEIQILKSRAASPAVIRQSRKEQ